MVSLRNALKTSPELETKGIWLERGNTRVRLKRAGGSNTAYNAAMAKIATEHGKSLKLNLISDDKANELMYDTFAEHVVTEWETNTGTEKEPVWEAGIEAENGTLLPVTLENVVAYWREIPEWFAECKETAENLQYFRQALISSTVKN